MLQRFISLYSGASEKMREFLPAGLSMSLGDCGPYPAHSVWAEFWVSALQIAENKTHEKNETCSNHFFKKHDFHPPFWCVSYNSELVSYKP